MEVVVRAGGYLRLPTRSSKSAGIMTIPSDSEVRHKVDAGSLGSGSQTCYHMPSSSIISLTIFVGVRSLAGPSALTKIQSRLMNNASNRIRWRLDSLHSPDHSICLFLSCVRDHVDWRWLHKK